LEIILDPPFGFPINDIISLSLFLSVQRIPFGVTFSNTVSKLKVQSSNVSFTTFQKKEMFEL